jgi:hypothetical protein
MPDATDLLTALAVLSDGDRRHLARLARDLADPDKISADSHLAALADVWLALAVLAAETTDAEARMLAELDAQLEGDDGLAGEIVGWPAS